MILSQTRKKPNPIGLKSQNKRDKRKKKIKTGVSNGLINCKKYTLKSTVEKCFSNTPSKGMQSNCVVYIPIRPENDCHKKITGSNERKSIQSTPTHQKCTLIKVSNRISIFLDEKILIK